MDTFITLLENGVDGTVKNLWELMVALAAIGVLSMALIEIIRLILQPRCLVNYFFFARSLPSQHQSALDEIVLLSTGGDALLLYRLPIERMVGQINAAAQIALAYPSTYRETIFALGQNADNHDLETVVNEDLKTENPQAYAEARNRVSNMIQRNLDALQLRINGYWSRGTQFAAIGLSTALIWIFVSPSVESPNEAARFFLISVAGGMVAPVAKDILGVLDKVKERTR